MKAVVLSLVIGTIITLGLFGLGYLAVDSNHISLSYMLYWQGKWLQVFVPCHNIGLVAMPECQRTRWYAVAFYAGIPFGILLYSSLVYAVLSVVRRLRTG